MPNPEPTAPKLLKHIETATNQLLVDVREIKTFLQQHSNDCGEAKETAWSRFKTRFKVWVAGGRSS